MMSSRDGWIFLVQATANPILKSVHDGLAVAKVCRQARRLGWAPVPPLYLEPGVCDRQAPVALPHGEGD